MRYRELGTTGMRVSEVGLGTWGLGGTAYGPIDATAAHRLVASALDAGVTLFDTSDVYGDGRSESLLGAALAGRGEEAVVATKVGMLPHQGFDVRQSFERAHVLGAVDRSLRRLRRERIDVYFLHSPPVDLPNWDDLGECFARLVEAGKIAHAGVSVRTPRDTRTISERFPFRVLQANFSLLDQRLHEDGVLRWCRKNGVGVFTRTPLCFGFLSGALSGEEVFGPADHRANWSRSQIRLWASAPAVFTPIAARQGRSLVQLALRFSLAPSAVAATIPGAMCDAELRENAEVADCAPLAMHEVRAVRRAYRRHRFFEPSSKAGMTYEQVGLGSSAQEVS